MFSMAAPDGLKTVSWDPMVFVKNHGIPNEHGTWFSQKLRWFGENKTGVGFSLKP